MLHQSLRRPESYLLCSAGIMQPLFMGLIIMSLFWKIPLEDYLLKYGVMLFAAIFLGFSSMAEVPGTIYNRGVAARQIRAGQYTPLSYVLSVFIAGLPLLVLQGVIFSVTIYFAVGFVEDAANFFTFLGLILLSAMAMGNFFRMMAFSAPNLEVAQASAAPFVIVFLAFSGEFCDSKQFLLPVQPHPLSCRLPDQTQSPRPLAYLGILAVPLQLAGPLLCSE